MALYDLVSRDGYVFGGSALPPTVYLSVPRLLDSYRLAWLLPSWRRSVMYLVNKAMKKSIGGDVLAA